jgi:hypothetical protein
MYTMQNPDNTQVCGKKFGGSETGCAYQDSAAPVKHCAEVALLSIDLCSGRSQGNWVVVQFKLRHYRNWWTGGATRRLGVEGMFSHCSELTDKKLKM